MTEPYVWVNDAPVQATEVVIVPGSESARVQEEAADESVVLSDSRRVAERASLLAAAAEATAQGRTADATSYNDLAAAIHS